MQSFQSNSARGSRSFTALLRNFSLKVPGVLCGFVMALAVLESAMAERPNVVLIVADDLGYGDVGFNGCKEIPTPNLDALAASGVVINAGYVSHPYCSPSRAGLLTGRYQQRFGHECNPEPGVDWKDDSAPGMSLDERTLANVFADAGYVTGAVGKWHLGDDKKFWPNRRGFQEWFGFSAGGLSYWGDTGKKPESFGVHRGDELVPREKLTHLTDDFSSEAVDFIRRHQDEPYFLYLAYNAPHAPNHATKAHLKLTEHIEYGGRSVYGAMVAGMDVGIGRVLKEIGSSNTMVIFISDNGGRLPDAMNFPYRGHKGMLFEGGVRVPFVIRWPKGLPAGLRTEQVASGLDVFPTTLAAAGIDLPGDLKLDGQNLIPRLQPDAKPEKRTLYWRYSVGEGAYGYAVRDGDMKLVDSRYKDRKMLFDLRNDPWEREDLSQRRPDEVDRLSAMIGNWDSKLIAPLWGDAHGANVIKEEEKRLKAINAASRGERKK